MLTHATCASFPVHNIQKHHLNNGATAEEESFEVSSKSDTHTHTRTRRLSYIIIIIIPFAHRTRLSHFFSLSVFFSFCCLFGFVFLYFIRS